MVKKGRLGGSETQQEEEVTAEMIRDRPKIPAGRFGRGLQETEALRERARVIRRVRGEAIEQAQRLESEFFSRDITTQQAREAFSQVDPRVRQFIKTTPQVRAQQAEATSAQLERQIQAEQKRLESAQGLEAKEIRVRISTLKGLRDEAASGAFNFERLQRLARRSGLRERRSLERRREFRQELRAEEVPERIIKRIVAKGGQVKITSKEAQVLTPKARRALGIKQTTVTETKTRTRQLTTSELLQRGFSPELAVKIKQGQGVSLEEARTLPKATRKELGLSEADFLNQKPVLVVSPREPPKTTLEKLERKIEDLRFTQRQTRATQILSGVTAGLLSTGTSTIRGIGAIPGFVSASVIGAPGLFKKFIKSPKQELKRLKFPTFPEVGRSLRQEPSFAAGRIGGEVLLFKGIGKATKFARTEKVVAKDPIDPIKTPKFRTFTEITRAGRGSKAVDVARFTVVGVKEERRVFVATRTQILKQKLLFKAARRKDLTVDQARVLFKGRTLPLEKTSIVIGRTEPFIIKRGKIKGTVGFVVSKRTVARQGSTRLGRIEGQIQRPLKLSTLNRNRLSDVDRELIRRVERLPSKGVDARVDIKNLKVVRGDVATKDIAKITAKEVKILSPEQIARSVRRGRLAVLQRRRAKVTGSKKEVEVFAERMSIADVSLPKFRKPKKLDLLQGITVRKEIELPASKARFNFLKGTRPTRQISKTKLDTQRLNLKASQVKGAVGLRATQALKTTSPKSIKSINRQLTTQKGQRTLLIPKTKSQQTLSRQSSQALVIPRSVTKTTVRNIPRTKTSELTKNIQKISPKLKVKQTQKLGVKQIPKLSTKQITKVVIPAFRPTTPRTGRPLPRARPLLLPRAEPKRRKLTRSLKPSRARQGAALVEGFTARQLNLRPIKIKPINIEKALRRQEAGVGIRLRPIILK